MSPASSVHTVWDHVHRYWWRDSFLVLRLCVNRAGQEASPPPESL